MKKQAIPNRCGSIRVMSINEAESFRQKTKRKKVINFLLGVLIVANLFSQLLLVLHHWKYAIVLYFGSKICFGFLYMIKIYGGQRPDAINVIKSLLILCWVFLDLFCLSFGFHMPFYFLNGHTFLWIWVFVIGFEGLKNSFTKEHRASNIFFILAAIFILLGVVIKFLHLLETNLILFIGIILGAYWMISESFRKKI